MESLRPDLDYRQDRLQAEAARRRLGAEALAAAPLRMATARAGRHTIRAITAATIVAASLLLSGMWATSLGAPGSSVDASSIQRATGSSVVIAAPTAGPFMTRVSAGGANGGAKPR
jgi:hypothetical protein